MRPSDSRNTLDYPVLEGRSSSVDQRRKYRVESVADAKSIAMQWLKSAALGNSISFGLPEVDDRYHIWRVPLKDRDGACCVGEVVIDARSSLVDFQKTTSPAVLESRLLHKSKRAASSFGLALNKYWSGTELHICAFDRPQVACYIGLETGQCLS